MPRHLLDEVLDAKAARTPAPPALPVTASGCREIPRLCSCTWKPSYSTLPATWTLTRAEPRCKLHGTEDGKAA